MRKAEYSGQYTVVSIKIREAICAIYRFLLAAVYWLLFTGCCLLAAAPAFAGELNLQELITITLKNNPEVLAYDARVSASKYRIPQEKSLPDPMFMLGYQNEGFKKYTYGEMLMAQWMFSVSQMIPFPGKLALKGEMAARDSESLSALYDNVRLAAVAKVKELYFDLYITYRDIDLIHDKTAFFSMIEDAALARYSSGTGSQQEIIMAQTEKYMLIEKEEMLKQRKQSVEAMLNAAAGRDVNSPLGRPGEPSFTEYSHDMNELLEIAYENSPDIRSKEKMIDAADAKVRLVKKEYYPDFTITGSIMKKTGPFEDMWSLETGINIPLFYKTKQKQSVLEAEAFLSVARNELESAKLMVASNIRDNYSMLKTAEKLMELYKNGLIPKTYQDFELALAGYTTGKVDILTVISRLKALLDFEFSYWEQLVEREKAIARLEALTTVNDLQWTAGTTQYRVSRQGDKDK